MRRLPFGALAAALSMAAVPALGAEPQPLSFTAGGASYVVPADGLTSVTTKENEGLTFCLSPDVAAAVTAFTKDHTDETVTIAIGETEVFRLKIVKPYSGGCINWPLHPHVAGTYRAMLTGEERTQ